MLYGSLRLSHKNVFNRWRVFLARTVLKTISFENFLHLFWIACLFLTACLHFAGKITAHWTDLVELIMHTQLSTTDETEGETIFYACKLGKTLAVYQLTYLIISIRYKATIKIYFSFGHIITKVFSFLPRNMAHHYHGRLLVFWKDWTFNFANAIYKVTKTKSDCIQTQQFCTVSTPYHTHII